MCCNGMNFDRSNTPATPLNPPVCTAASCGTGNKDSGKPGKCTDTGSATFWLDPSVSVLELYVHNGNYVGDTSAPTYDWLGEACGGAGGGCSVRFCSG